MTLKTCQKCGRNFTKDVDFLEHTSHWRMCSAENLWFDCSCGSTLLLPKGKFPWYKPEQRMSSKAASLFNELAELKNLPHIPHSVMKLNTLVDDPETSVEELANHVKLDPFIATDILAIANNLRNSRNPLDEPLTSIEHALVYVGRSTLKELVVLASIRSFTFRTKNFDAQSFWRESLLTANVAESFAVEFAPELVKDQVYLAGFLCNLGKVVGAIALPSDVDAAQKRAEDKKIKETWCDAEMSVNSKSHVILGEIGACLWGLPDYISDCAGSHHSVLANTKPKRGQEIPTVLNIVTIANQATHLLLGREYRVETNVLDKTLQVMKLEKKTFEDYYESLRDLVKKCSSLLQ